MRNMQINSSVFTTLPDPPLWTYADGHSDLSQHPSLSNCIIISIPIPDKASDKSNDEMSDDSNSEMCTGIYVYNLESNETSLLYEHGGIIEPERHGQVVDSKNCIVYSFGQDFFSRFDLKTKTMQDLPKIYDQMQVYTTLDNPQAVYIQSIEKIHIVQCNMHCVFDIVSNSITPLQKSSKLENIVYSKLLYIPLEKRLMIFGSHDDARIFSCDADDNSSEYEWEKSKYLTMPCRVPHRSYGILLGFTDVVFVFYCCRTYRSEGIYLLDLITRTWFKSQYYVPGEIYFHGTPACVVQNNYDVHLLNFWGSHHVKACLFDLVPKELTVSRKKYYSMLVMGYLRDKEKNFSITVAVVLKKLILDYFPIFVK